MRQGLLVWQDVHKKLRQSHFILVQVLSKDEDLGSSVGEHSSFPLVTAKKDILANESAKIMASKNIKRLGLTQNNSLVGIVTARDIVDAYQMGI